MIFSSDLNDYPSGEITNILYLTKIAKLKKIIISTGMAAMKIADALKNLTKNGTSKKYYCFTLQYELSNTTQGCKFKAILSIKENLK